MTKVCSYCRVRKPFSEFYRAPLGRLGLTASCKKCHGLYKRGERTLIDRVARFWVRIDKTGNCWIWKGTVLRSGYGQLMFGGKKFRAHRLAWEMTNGPIPNRSLVLHRCDNPRCVNPEHLFLGSPKDNMIDKMEKGRCFNGKAKRFHESIQLVLATPWVAQKKGR